jgi:hypothetical protein
MALSLLVDHKQALQTPKRICGTSIDQHINMQHDQNKGMRGRGLANSDTCPKPYPWSGFTERTVIR